MCIRDSNNTYPNNRNNYNQPPNSPYSQRNPYPGNNDRHYQPNRNYNNNNYNNNRVSRPRVNFIRAEDRGPRRYYQPRRNSFHGGDRRWRSAERDGPRHEQGRRSTSLEDLGRQQNREINLEQGTERQETTQSFPNDASVNPSTNDDHNTLNGRRQ